MKAKKFKTISGYLNNMADQIRVAERDVKEGDRALLRTDLRRRAINHLLSQFELGKIGPDENPRDGIVRMNLNADETDTSKRKKLDELLRWFGRQRTFIGVKSSATVERSDGMETRRFSGFSREDQSKRFTIVLDVPTAYSPTAFKAAEEIAGPDVCFITSMNITGTVPDDIKGRLLTIEEYYSAMPEEAPNYRRPRKSARRRGEPSSIKDVL